MNIKHKASLGMAFLLSLLLQSSVLAEANSGYLDKPRSYFDQAEYRSAMIELKNILQASPEDALARLMLGKTYLKINDPAAAEKEFRRALQYGGDKSDVLPLLGQSYLRQGKFQLLRDEINVDAKATAVNQAVIYALRGDAAIMLHLLDDARSDYDGALKLVPDHASALLGQIRLALIENNVDQAKGQLQTLLQLDQNNVDGWIIKAELLRRDSKYVDSLQAFSRAVEIEPGNIGALLGKAALEVQNKLLDDAVKDLQRVQKIAPNLPAANYLQGVIHFQRQELDLARESINETLKLAPKHLQAQFLLGVIDYGQGQLEQAEYYLSNFVAMAPGHTPARKILAATYLKLKQPGKAIETLDVVVESEANDSQLLALLGNAYLQVGDSSKGTEYLQKAAEIAPDAAAIRTQLALGKLATGDAGSAIDDLEMAVDMDESLLQADLLLIYTHLRGQNFEKAIAAAQALIKKQPDNPLAHNLLAVCLASKGDYEKAKTQFRKTLAVEPKFTAAYMGLAEIAMRQGDQQTAEKQYQQILQIDPKNIAAMLAMARMANAAGETAKAFEWIEMAQQKNPRSIEPPVLLANAYLKKGDRLKALSKAKEAQQLQPKNPNVLTVLAMAQIANDDVSNGLASLRTLVELQPNSDKALLLLAEGQIKAKQFKEAATTLEKLIKRNDAAMQAYVLLTSVKLELGEHQQALELARKVQAQHPEHGVGHELEGNVYLATKEAQKAEASFSQAFSKNKTATLAVKLHRVRVSLAQENSIEPLEAWLVKDPDDWKVRQIVAMAYQGAGTNGKAIAAYEQVLVAQPNDLVSLNNLAWLLQENGDKQAVDYAERLYAIAANNPAVVDTVGWILVQNGQVDRGLVMLQDAKIRAPHIVDIGYHLAIALDKAGRRAEARKELERLLRDHPEFENKTAANELLHRLQSE